MLECLQGLGRYVRLFAPALQEPGFSSSFLICFWLRWVMVAVCGLSLVAVSRGYSSLQCTGFSLWWLLLLQSMGSKYTGSVVAAHGLSSCSAWASVVVVHGLSSCGLQALERRLSSCATRA